MIDRETVGMLLGYALVIAVIIGLPYLIGSFIEFNLHPGQWPQGDRAVAAFASLLLLAGYGVSRLPNNSSAIQ